MVLAKPAGLHYKEDQEATMDARRISLVVALLAVVVATTISAYSFIARDENGVAAIGGDFQLTDHTGREVRTRDFAGRHMLVYFGYTFCPDICPTELQSMSLALDALGDEAAAVRPVFITIDPDRDTVPVLDTYRRHFHPDLVALTGPTERINAAAKAYRVYFAKGVDDGTGDYLMEHSSIVFLMGPDGRYIRHFGANTPPEVMAAGIREVL